MKMYLLKGGDPMATTSLWPIRNTGKRAVKMIVRQVVDYAENEEKTKQSLEQIEEVYTMMNSRETVQSVIQTSTIVNKDNPIYETEGGNNTKDKVFLLSYEERKKYFNNNDESCCKPTAYTVTQGAEVFVFKEGKVIYLIQILFFLLVDSVFINVVIIIQFFQKIIKIIPSHRHLPLIHFVMRLFS